MDPASWAGSINLETPAARLLRKLVEALPPERPVTITHGTNIMVGPDKGRILDAYRRISNGDWKPAGPPEYWDGHTAERIIRVIRAIRD